MREKGTERRGSGGRTRVRQKTRGKEKGRRNCIDGEVRRAEEQRDEGGGCWYKSPETLNPGK